MRAHNDTRWFGTIMLLVGLGDYVFITQTNRQIDTRTLFSHVRCLPAMRGECACVPAVLVTLFSGKDEVAI